MFMFFFSVRVQGLVCQGIKAQAVKACRGARVRVSITVRAWVRVGATVTVTVSRYGWRSRGAGSGGGEGWPAERKRVRGCRGGAREGGARGARLWRVGRSAAGGGDAAASDLQIKGGGARQGSAVGKAAGLHLGQGGQGRLVEVGAHRSTACDEKS